MAAEDANTVSADPRVTLGQSSMRFKQILAIAMCVALNALDGFDVLSISFASPGIADEWGINRAALGVVLSMELFGMAVGSVWLGQVADKIGRRPTALGCLAVMALGMFSTSQVDDITVLSATRLFTGLGIGGMLAVTNAFVAEHSNDRWRGAAVAIMAAGYPMGVIIGGSFASQLLATGGWRDIFLMGSVATAFFIPLVVFLLPESVNSVMQRRPADALQRVNKSLKALGHKEVSELPPPDPVQKKSGVKELFKGRMKQVTLLLTMAYFFHIMTFYFIIKWVPKIVVDMGFDPSSAGGVLVWANVGGLAGSLLFSVLTLRYSIKALVMAALVASTIMVTVFGLGQADLVGLSLAAAAGGFCTNAGVVGLYALFAQSFPTAVRAGGTGFVIGMGRGGAALAPVVAGVLFQSGLSLPIVATIMASGSLIAAIGLIGLPKPEETEETEEASGVA